MKKYWCIGFGLACLSCGKTNQSYIPNVSVSFSASLSDPRLSALSSNGGAVLLTGGVAGYDRCSSYEPEKRCAVTLDSPTFTVTDPCSGAKFSLTDGSPVKAPATQSLKAYTVSIGNNLISVYN
jgi:nitrite reductase/ring-hydroxylating ferredoxin subunit